MAGTALASRVRPSNLEISGLAIKIADASDDADVRKLLRETPMGGAISLRLQREPSIFQPDLPCVSSCFIIGRDVRTGKVAGIAERVVRLCYVNGTPRRLPYIASLRVAPDFRNRLRVLQAGFTAIEVLAEEPGDLPFALSSIAEDNDVAQRILTRGLPSLPTYRQVGSYSTFLLGVRKGALPAGFRCATPDDFPAIVDFLKASLSRKQFAPCWQIGDLIALQRLGLPADHIVLSIQSGRINGCIGVWSQFGFKQAVVDRYPKHLSILRPLLNQIASWGRLPTFPAAGEPLRFSKLAFATAEHDCPAVFRRLVAAGLTVAAGIGASGVLLGIDGDSVIRAKIPQWWRLALEYKTRLYLVHSASNADVAERIEPRLLAPELGFL